jgi:hypothetical protein
MEPKVLSGWPIRTARPAGAVMHAILQQAKGAQWVIVGLAGVAGLASGLVAKFMP